MKNALGVSIALVAVLWTWLVLGWHKWWHHMALVWAGFIAWGAYFTVGKNALGKTIAATIFGSFMAIVAVFILALDR